MESAYYRKVQPKVGGWMKKTAKNKNLLIALLFIVPIASFITFSNKGILQRMTMESRKVEMEARVKKAENEQRKLQGQTKALDNDPRAIEKVARERYGMTREGETVYKVKKEK